MSHDYRNATLAPEQVSSLDGPTLLDFGTDWCGHCRIAGPMIAQAVAEHPQVRHLKVEDGPGRPLGRSFRVKLWPTLVFLKDGHELHRLVRPVTTQPILDALSRLR